MTWHFLQPEEKRPPGQLPGLEVLFMSEQEFTKAVEENDDSWVAQNLLDLLDKGHDTKDATKRLSGWYYWYHYAGSMSENDGVGPYPSEEEALAAALEAGEPG